MDSLSTPNMLHILYRLHFEDGHEFAYHAYIDPYTLTSIDPGPLQPPAWTRLEYHQCPNCPLEATAYERCPAALKLVTLLNDKGELWSHQHARVQVNTPERTILREVPVSMAMGSLLGLVLATSGCPNTEFLKPMARFHLPFASELETVYRAASMYLLAQYFLQQTNRPTDFNLSNLAARYHALQSVNTALSARLAAASKEDATLNAIGLLNLLARAMPYSIEESLKQIRHLFYPFLHE